MKSIPAFVPDQKHLHVVIETPSGSCGNTSGTRSSRVLKLKRLLPLGIASPFDFGFVPGTKADDGDPLDVCCSAMCRRAPGR